MTAAIFVSFGLFAVYLAAVIRLSGVPASISDSYYLLESRKKGLGYVFTLWCWAIAFAVAAMMFELSAGQWYQFLGLFAGGGLAFTGAAPLFKSHERTVHYCAAGVCAASALTWMCAAGLWYVPATVLTACAGVNLRQGKPVFWIETGLF